MDEVKLLKYSQTIDSIISGHEPAVLYHDIPRINRVHGPYRKLWTEFLSSPYRSSVKRAGHKKRENNEDP